MTLITKDTKFQRLAKDFLWSTIATCLDTNFAATGEYERKSERALIARPMMSKIWIQPGCHSIQQKIFH